MRVVVVLLIVLCAGALSQARAAEPQSPSAPESAPTPAEAQSATAPGGEHSTTTPAAPATPAASTTPAVTAVAPDAGKAAVTRAERELTSRGYQLEIRHGQRYFCRREPQLGSHFDIKSCNTAESIQSHRDSSVETVREMQANKPEISN
jgi:hypothetical protein